MKSLALVILLFGHSSFAEVVSGKRWEGKLAKDIIQVLINSDKSHLNSLVSHSYVEFDGVTCDRRSDLARSPYASAYGFEYFSCYRSSDTEQRVESNGLLYNYLKKIGFMETTDSGVSSITVPALTCRVWSGLPEKDPKRYVCELK